MAEAGQFKLAVDENLKATEFPLWRVRGSVQENPHMRAFWAATFSFFLAFFGWFALAPIELEVAESLGICENHKYPPTLHPTRTAFLKFENLKTGTPYCRYGTVGDPPTDCKASPDFQAGGENSDQLDDRYNSSVLSDCVCSAGTECRRVLAAGGTASVASTIVVRISLGGLLKRFGPVNVQSGLLVYGAFWVSMAACITATWNYILIRCMIGCVGAAFVTNQFWCSMMFAPRVVGSVNATAGGWGNLGGGVVQFFMVVVLFQPFVSAGMSKDTAWRVAMVVPALLFLICAASVRLLCWDMPTSRRFVAVEDGAQQKGSIVRDYFEVLKDPRVIVMVFQYSACFGTELVMNNRLATHFRTYFQLAAGEAASLAACFGLMNLFARSLGGISSDVLFAKVGFRGRIWAQFFALFLEACFLFGFGSVTNEQPWYVALAVLVCFSTSVQMAEGTSFAIVPFMRKQSQVAVVAALVGAGGNLGAVIAGTVFYHTTDDPLLPYRMHAGYVMFWAMCSFVYYWPEHGGMFVGPKRSAEAVAKAEASPAEESEERPVCGTGSPSTA